jgi:indole-3-glycerol phosphate synthase / phosphoribosylanthranilate isomerase
MPSKIDEILTRKHLDVAARKRARPHIECAPRPHPNCFRAALSRDAQPTAAAARFILEAKRASPSEGSLRTTLTPRDVVAGYEHIASAISVLTDEPFFGGNFEFLRELRALTSTPLLCKDFVVDAYQVTEACSYGADAILLMLCVLDDNTIRACLAEAARLGMDALVEVHDERELDRALHLPAPIIGINNRSFQDLSVDLQVTERLALRVGRDRTLITESGIRDHKDVVRLAPHVDGFLVGSSLMKQANLRQAALALTSARVKICGLTSAEDAALAYQAGASYGGVIFAQSARRVSLTTAQAIAKATPLPLVGVFRDATVNDVVEAAASLNLTAVQLHGQESSAYLSHLRAELEPTTEVWKTIAVDADTAADGAVVADEPAASRLLFDSQSKHVSGGSGQVFNWQRVAQHPRIGNAFLAGGIHPGNVAKARALGVFGLDVCSGSEDEPGRKSPSKLHELFANLRVPGRTRP